MHSLDHGLADGGQTLVTVTSPPPWGGLASQTQVPIHQHRQMDRHTDRQREGAQLASLAGARRWLKHRW